MHKILVVGQTPPPHGGQAIMIKRILQQKYSKMELFHVRMSFSSEMDDIGRFQIVKIWRLLSLLVRILIARINYGTRVLYYPPAGPDKIPMYRDFVILICARWLFKKTIFQIHAGGISDVYPRLSSFEKFLFRAAYSKPDGTILLSELNPRDDEKVESKQNFVIPYGIEDNLDEAQPNQLNKTPVVLFVGILKESKGILVLLEALSALRSRGIDFKAVMVGKFESSSFEEIVSSKVTQSQLESHIEFPGVLTGDEKWRQFSNADIFCYPTFFESETFGLVVLEAMQFKLPTIVSDWRGVPSLVREGQTGYIVPAKNSKLLANKIELLCQDRELARELGNNGRADYLDSYSLKTFHNRIEDTFVQVSEQNSRVTE